MNYNEMWRSLTAVYDDSEAKAVVRMLLEERYGLSLADVLTGGIDSIDDIQKEQLGRDFIRLQQGEPVQHVLGYAFFSGHRFKVTPDTLIPRPETEELVNAVTKFGEHVTGYENTLYLLDIGTGSGCIAISLALEHPHWQVSACDISDEALAVARQNANDLNTKVSFFHADILAPNALDGSWNIIVSNPPYICEREKADMHDNVLQHEPHTALFVPDDDPLLFYRAIAHYAARSLHQNGMLFFEINPLYAAQTAVMMHKEGFTDIETVTDQFGRQRFVIGKKV